jgi:hypothetical protein
VKYEVVATINDSETGNDAVYGRQLTGSPPLLQTANLRLWVTGLRRAALLGAPPNHGAVINDLVVTL